MSVQLKDEPRTRVRKLAGHIGAEISGVDISAPLSADVVAELRQALLENKVIFFRNQDLDHGKQIAFARQFLRAADPPRVHGAVPLGAGQRGVLG